MPTEFETDTAVKRISDNHFAANITDRWNGLFGPNGGYVISIAACALGETLPFPDPLSISAHFLKAPTWGPVEIVADQLRAGRRHASGEARMMQSGDEIARVIATYADLSTASGRSEPSDPVPHFPSPEDAIDVFAHVPEALHVSFLDRIEGRMVEVPGWLKGNPSGVMDVVFACKLKDQEQLSPLAFPLICDSGPPTVVELGEVGAITVEMTIHSRRRPAPGWLICRAVGSNVAGGYMDEDFTIWDSEGQVVATSRQLAMIVKS